MLSLFFSLEAQTIMPAGNGIALNRDSTWYALESVVGTEDGWVGAHSRFLFSFSSNLEWSVVYEHPPEASADLADVLFADRRYVAVGRDEAPGQALVVTTRDLMDFDAGRVAGLDSLEAVEFSGGVWVATGERAGAAISSDGRQWAPIDSLAGERSAFVTRGDGVWVVEGFRSDDAIKWGRDSRLDGFVDMAWMKGLWVGVRERSGPILSGVGKERIRAATGSVTVKEKSTAESLRHSHRSAWRWRRLRSGISMRRSFWR